MAPTQHLKTPKRLNQPEVRAKVRALVLEGLTDRAIAKRVGVDHSNVTRWRARHAAELHSLTAKIERKIEGAAISKVVSRVWDAQGDYDRLGGVIDARSKDDRYDEPGYATGVMVHQVKSVAAGDNAQLVDEYKVDTALVAERRMLRRAVAEELDQLPRAGVVINDNRIQLVQVRYVIGGEQE